MDIQIKELEFDGFNFKIQKFTPEIACRWAFRFLGTTATIDGDGFSDKVAKFIDLITEDPKQFASFQKDCLSRVLVKMEAGSFPLMNDEGFLIIPEGKLKNTSIFQLTLNAFMFTISDFFAPALIQGMWAAVLGSLPKRPTETSSSSPSDINTGVTMTSETANIQ